MHLSKHTVYLYKVRYLCTNWNGTTSQQSLQVSHWFWSGFVLPLKMKDVLFFVIDYFHKIHYFVGVVYQALVTSCVHGLSAQFSDLSPSSIEKLLL